MNSQLKIVFCYDDYFISVWNTNEALRGKKKLKKMYLSGKRMRY